METVILVFCIVVMFSMMVDSVCDIKNHKDYTEWVKSKQNQQREEDLQDKDKLIKAQRKEIRNLKRRIKQYEQKEEANQSIEG